MLQYLLYLIVLLFALVILYNLYFVIINVAKIPKNAPYKVQLFNVFPVRIPILASAVFVGNHHYITKTIQSDYCKPHKAYYVVAGSLFGVYTGDANDIKLLAISRAGKMRKPSAYEATKVFGENIVSVAEYAEWRKHRLLCNPAFADDHLRLVAETAVHSFHLLDKIWRKQKTEQGIIIDPSSDMARLTFDVIGKVGFGYDLHVMDEKPKPLENGHTMTFKDALDYSANTLIMVRTILPSALLPLFDKPRKEVDRYLDEIIQERLKSKEKQHDLLSMMMTLNESEVNEKEDLGEQHDHSKLGRTKLTMQEIKSDAFIFLFAGHDTTSTNLQWIMYELALHPEFQEKMKEEADAIVGDRDPEFNDFSSFKYILNVAQESLRMHPPVNLVFKEVKEDMNLTNGLLVKANTMVVFPIYSLHHDPDYWDEPEKFNPDRFNSPLKHPYAYLPFSTGSRSCIGSKFSLIETVLILAALVKKYTIHFPPGFNPNSVYEHTLVVCKPGNLKIMLKDR